MTKIEVQRICNNFNSFTININKDRRTLTSKLNFLGVRLRDFVPNMSRNVYARSSTFSLSNNIMIIQIDVCYISEGVNYCHEVRKKIRSNKFMRLIKLKNLNSL